MNFSALAASPLFAGIAANDLEAMLGCLGAIQKEYPKGSFILHAGDHASAVGLVVTGFVQVIREDYQGNRQILTTLGPGQLFSESYACVPKEPLLVSVMADHACTILFLDVRRILTLCSSACSFHTRLIQNLLSVLAQKNLELTRKIDHMGQKTTRDKVLSYLSAQAALQKRREFDISLNRQELADYLTVDRSALSAELSRMQKDGLLSYSRNHFKLH